MASQSILTNGAAIVTEMNLKTHILPWARKPLLSLFLLRDLEFQNTGRGWAQAHGHAGSSPDSASFLGRKGTFRAAPALPHNTHILFSPTTRPIHAFPRVLGHAAGRGQIPWHLVYREDGGYAHRHGFLVATRTARPGSS